MKVKFKNYEINSVDELVRFAEANILDNYHGLYEVEKAVMYSSINPEIIIHIDFDNVYECKLFESKIRKNCRNFSPKKYGISRNSTLGISETLKQELIKLKHDKESFEIVIWRLLLNYYNIS